MSNQNELTHYGVVGMKWGVRRYQNKDGSYTKAGLNRYNMSEAIYKQDKELTDLAKKAYKSTKKNGYAVMPNGDKVQVTKEAVKNGKATVRADKKRMKRAYKQLKLDAKADAGKARYQSGQTITGRGEIASGLITLGGTAAVGAKYLSSMRVIDKKTATALYAAGAAATGAGFITGILNKHGDSQIRAYYSHESQRSIDEKIFGDVHKGR